MIYLNVTFIVQIVHFLFAWWALTRFLFRPIVSAIQYEKVVQTRLENTVTTEQELLEKAEKEQQRQWVWYQKQFKKRIPQLVTHRVISENSFKSVELIDLSKRIKKDDIAALTDLVVARVSHD